MTPRDVLSLVGLGTQQWERVLSLDATLRALAARHYSRQTPGSVQLAPPGKRLYFATPDRKALWASSHQRFVKSEHRRDSWVCTFFRNERPRTEEDPGGYVSSELVTLGVAATCHCWAKVLPRGMATEIDVEATRRKRDPGRCFRKAGFKDYGERTKRGLVILRLLPEQFPAPLAPLGELGLRCVT